MTGPLKNFRQNISSHKTKEFGDKEWENKMKYRSRSEASQIFRLCNTALSSPNHIMATTWQTLTNNAGDARKSQDGKCTFRGTGRKGIDNEKRGYPKTKFGRCAEGKLHLPCWEAGGTRSTDHEHKVRPKRIDETAFLCRILFSIAPQGRGDNISFRRFYFLVPQCDRSRGIPRETNLSIV